YQKAAEQGHITSHFSLGLLYQDGKGVEQDFASAAKWYQKAAEQGHITSQFNLGLLYQDGKGVEQDFASAAK
ncbi:tetratricopeptide repeat protein, partial [Psychrobacter faecalis]|uniref:tetratricopeptide repeat protein n=1 Tax=Psychrobacter faecalis TaxID=180588 RepID=UPI003FD3610A